MRTIKYGKLVFVARARAGLTQSKLARKCGMKQESIARIESGRSLPSTRTLETIAKALGKEIIISFK